MTIEELESVRGMASEVQAIQNEIESLYTPICSPNGQSSGGHSNTPSDPTERAVNRILVKRDELEEKRKNLADAVSSIEDWLNKVDDPDIRSIVRWHYFLGLDWSKTCKKVLGYPSYYAARKRIERFFEENC